MHADHLGIFAHNLGTILVKTSKMLELSTLNDPFEDLSNTLRFTYRYKLGVHLSAFYVDFYTGYPAYFWGFLERFC